MHFHQLAAGNVGASGCSADDVFLVLLMLAGLSSRGRLSVSVVMVSAVFNGWLSATVRKSPGVLVVLVWSDIFISPLLLFLCMTNFRCRRRCRSSRANLAAAGVRSGFMYTPPDISGSSAWRSVCADLNSFTADSS